MVLNYLFILLILLIAAFIGYKAYTQIMNNDDAYLANEEEETINLHWIENYVADVFSNRLRTNLKEENYTEAQYRKKEKDLAEFSEAMSLSSSGDVNAKRIILGHTCDVLRSKKLGLTESVMNQIIPFGRTKELSSRDKFEIVAYKYISRKGVPRERWLGDLIKDYSLDTPVYIENSEGDKQGFYLVTDARFAEVYEDLESNGYLKLDFNDKINILAQRIFEDKYGLGPVDLCLEANIDEIDVGQSGDPLKSTWITYSGKCIHFEPIYFDEEDDLIRVVDNIYQYDAPYVMSTKDAKIVARMKNGNRITAARPPFAADNYMFWCRMFKSAPGNKLRELLHKDKNPEILIGMLKWMIRAQQTGGVTGGQGTGKTTFMRAMVEFSDPAHNIRVSEIQSEIDLRSAYDNRNICAFQETDYIDSQMGLDFMKKTNGQVNLIGEVAEAKQAYFVVQTSGIASYYTLFSSHHNTTKKLVLGFADNMMQVGQAATRAEAIEAVVRALNFDVHLVNIHGDRYCERLTVILPVEQDDKYPSEYLEDKTSELAERIDTIEYYHRSTNPDQFTTMNLVENHDHCFYLVNDPPKALLDRMANILSPKEMELFLQDVAYFKELSKDYKKTVE